MAKKDRKVKDWSVDPESYELAKHFLPNGTEQQLSRLSQDIQNAVESWFESEDASIEEVPEREPDSDRTLGLTR